MVPVEVIPLSTTYGQIIEIVCQKINESETSHFYLTMNYEIELENQRVFKPQDKDQKFQLIMRTKWLLEYIAEQSLGRQRWNHGIMDELTSTDEVPSSVTDETSQSETINQMEDLSGDRIPMSGASSSTTADENKKKILTDVVRSTISKIPRRDVQKYLHQVLEKKFDILLMGSPRVGKSTLINAILKKDAAKTSAGRSTCTTSIESYEYQETYTSSTDNTQTATSVCSIRIWDAPGIENWTKIDVAKYVRNLVQEKNPICLIYCASPGSYTDIEHVKTIIEECKKLKIFVAMIVTNMYASDDADLILETFQNLLACHHEQTKVDTGIYHYGHVGLCAEVNSIEYKAMGVTMQSTGVYELMLAIMNSLNEDKLLQWCFALMDNGPFWIKKQSTIWKMFGFFNFRQPFLYIKNLIGY